MPFPSRFPPLSERNGDIPLLVDHFLKKYNQRLGKNCRFSSECLDLLERYPFPGNVRELENEIVRAMTLAAEGEELRPSIFPIPVREKGSGVFPGQGGFHSGSDRPSGEGHDCAGPEGLPGEPQQDRPETGPEPPGIIKQDQTVRSGLNAGARFSCVSPLRGDHPGRRAEPPDGRPKQGPAVHRGGDHPGSAAWSVPALF